MSKTPNNGSSTNQSGSNSKWFCVIRGGWGNNGEFYLVIIIIIALVVGGGSFIRLALCCKRTRIFRHMRRIYLCVNSGLSSKLKWRIYLLCDCFCNGLIVIIMPFLVPTPYCIADWVPKSWEIRSALNFFFFCTGATETSALLDGPLKLRIANINRLAQNKRARP